MIRIFENNTSLTFTIAVERDCCNNTISVDLLTENGGTPVYFATANPVGYFLPGSNTAVISLDISGPIPAGIYQLGFRATGCDTFKDFLFNVEVLTNCNECLDNPPNIVIGASPYDIQYNSVARSFSFNLASQGFCCIEENAALSVHLPVIRRYTSNADYATALSYVTVSPLVVPTTGNTTIGISIHQDIIPFLAGLPTMQTVFNQALDDYLGTEIFDIELRTSVCNKLDLKIPIQPFKVLNNFLHTCNTEIDLDFSGLTSTPDGLGEHDLDIPILSISQDCCISGQNIEVLFWTGGSLSNPASFVTTLAGYTIATTTIPNNVAPTGITIKSPLAKTPGERPVDLPPIVYRVCSGRVFRGFSLNNLMAY